MENHTSMPHTFCFLSRAIFFFLRLYFFCFCHHVLFVILNNFVTFFLCSLRLFFCLLKLNKVTVEKEKRESVPFPITVHISNTSIQSVLCGTFKCISPAKWCYILQWLFIVDVSGHYVRCSGSSYFLGEIQKPTWDLHGRYGLLVHFIHL